MTVANLIDAALRNIQVIAAGETASTQEYADSLLALNELIASWSAQALPIYQITRSTVSLNGAASYALGTRPVKIKGANITGNGLVTPVAIATSEEWATGGGTAAQPLLWADAGFPSTTIYLRPAPSGGTLELHEYRALAAFAATSDTVTLPPGYGRALINALSVELAPQFGRPVDDVLMGIMNDAKTSIFGLNQVVLGHPAGQQAELPKAA